MKKANDKKYIRMYLQLKEDITQGFYPYGAKMPSKRAAAESFGVSVITAEHVYGLLCEEGYCEASERRGYFVIYKRAEKFAADNVSYSVAENIAEKSDAAERAKSAKNIAADKSSNGSTAAKRATAVELSESAEHTDAGETETTSANENDRRKESFPFTPFAAAVRKTLSDMGEKLMEKCPPQGLPRLRTAIRDYLARARGIRADSEQIIIGAGAEYLYSFAAHIFGNDKVFAIEKPSYEKIRLSYISCGAKVVYLPLDKDGVAAEALSACRANVLHITPYRSYPSGVTASATKRAQYVQWAEKNSSFIVEDDYESEYTVLSKPEDTVFSLDGGRRTVYINTFSMTVAPSCRAGYMVIPKCLMQKYNQTAVKFSCSVPTLIQHSIAEIIENGQFERHIARVRRARRTLIR